MRALSVDARTRVFFAGDVGGGAPMNDDVCGAEAIVNLAHQGARYVQPAPAAVGWPLNERNVRAHSPVIDYALGGVAPGHVIVVTATHPEMRLALANDLAHSWTAHGWRVVLATRGESWGAHGDGLRSLHRVTSLDGARRRERKNMRRRSDRKHVERITLARRVIDADVAARALAQDREAKLLVVCDADGFGTVDGAEALRGWRELAARRAIPVVVIVSGHAPGWDVPEDAHVELMTTHFGEQIRCIGRGVPRRSAERRRFAVCLDRETGQLRARTELGLGIYGDNHSTPWAAETDFDGVFRVRPTVVSMTELAKKLGDARWKPRGALEGGRVLEALAVAVLLHTEGGEWAGALAGITPDRVREVVSSCGSSERWGDVVESVLRSRPCDGHRLTSDLRGNAHVYGVDPKEMCDGDEARLHAGLAAERARRLTAIKGQQARASEDDSSGREELAPRYDIEALRRAMSAVDTNDRRPERWQRLPICTRKSWLMTICSPRDPWDDEPDVGEAAPKGRRDKN